jgi:hypothetical protein
VHRGVTHRVKPVWHSLKNWVLVVSSLSCSEVLDAGDLGNHVCNARVVYNCDTDAVETLWAWRFVPGLS